RPSLSPLSLHDALPICPSILESYQRTASRPSHRRSVLIHPSSHWPRYSEKPAHVPWRGRSLLPSLAETCPHPPSPRQLLWLRPTAKLNPLEFRAEPVASADQS